MPRRKRKSDPSKNRKLNEFLTILQIDIVKKERIIDFVEKLTFDKIVENSKKKSKPAIRLKR